MKINDRDVPELTPQQDRWLTTDETAHYMGVKVETLSKWRLRGNGPRYSAALKRDPRYRLSDLMAHMSAKMASNTREARTVREISASERFPITLRRPTRPRRGAE